MDARFRPAPPARDAEAERQHTRLVEGITDYAIFLLDPAGKILSWNAGAARIKGYTAEEVAGRHFSLLYTAEDRARDHPAHELEIATREGRYEEEGWRVRKDGSRFWANVIITAVRDEDGVLIGFGKVTRDLTARRLSEEQLRARHAELRVANAQLEQFRRLVESVHDYAIFMLDPGGHVATWNSGAQLMKGYTAEDIIGRPFALFYTAEDRARDHPAHELEIAAREGRYEEEGWRVRKDGSRFWANVVITAVRNDSGVLGGFAKVTRDLTTRRATEQALRVAHEDLRRSNEELERFAVVAAHDLREPLTTVAGFAALLEERHARDMAPDARQYLEHITASADRMRRLIDSLLSYARSGGGDPATHAVDVRAAAERVIDDLAVTVRERSAQVVVRIDGDVRVRADESDVELVLQNLLSNALKFGDARAPRVELSAAYVSDGTWRMTVADNGIGIDPAQHDQIFDAFTRGHPQLKRDGTGLGLAICERIVRRHGGRIAVESQPAQGSRFWFTLPAA